MNLMTPAEIQAKYRWARRSTLYAAMKDGLLPFYRLPSGKGKKGKYLIDEAAFLAWVESNRHEGGAAGSAPLKLKHL